MSDNITALNQLREAVWTEVAGRRIVADYGTPPATLRHAVQEGVALVDQSHWGLLRVSGAHQRRFLHNMTTVNVNALQSGEILAGTFVTATGRIIDETTLIARPDDILLLVSPERRAILPGWFQRFIFFNDEVIIEDVTDQHAVYTLIGPQSLALLAAVGAPPTGAEGQTHWVASTIAGIPVLIFSAPGLDLPHYSVLVGAEQGHLVWEALHAQGEPLGLALMGETGWEELRISRGWPRADLEITEEHNPLEMGFWHAVSFAKGCYIGQEVIARLDTYQKVKQRLMLVRLASPAAPGTALTVGEETVGTLTSVVPTAEGAVGLAFIRSKSALPDQAVQAGDIPATLTESPSLTWGRTDIPA